MNDLRSVSKTGGNLMCVSKKMIMFFISNIIFLPIPHPFILKITLSILVVAIVYFLIGHDLNLIYKILLNKNKKTV